MRLDKRKRLDVVSGSGAYSTRRNWRCTLADRRSSGEEIRQPGGVFEGDFEGERWRDRKSVV